MVPVNSEIKQNDPRFKKWLVWSCSFIIIMTMLLVNGYTGEEWLEPFTGALFFPFLFSGLMLGLMAVSSGTAMTQNHTVNAIVVILNSIGAKIDTNSIHKQYTYSIIIAAINALLFILNAVAMFRANSRNSILALLLLTIPCFCSLSSMISSFTIQPSELQQSDTLKQTGRVPAGLPPKTN